MHPFRSIWFFAAAALIGLSAPAPVQAASWLEKGIYLSGPNYDGVDRSGLARHGPTVGDHMPYLRYITKKLADRSQIDDLTLASGDRAGPRIIGLGSERIHEIVVMRGIVMKQTELFGARFVG